MTVPENVFRGINPEIFENVKLCLAPKENAAFIKPAEYGRAEFSNFEYNFSERNAVIEHQQHQAGYPTSGISTTPDFARAAHYATHDGKFEYGFVFVIDTDLCREHGVAIYRVNDLVPQPSVPEDDEVILVSPDNGPLPNEVIIDVVRT